MPVLRSYLGLYGGMGVDRLAGLHGAPEVGGGEMTAHLLCWKHKGFQQQQPQGEGEGGEKATSKGEGATQKKTKSPSSGAVGTRGRKETGGGGGKGGPGRGLSGPRRMASPDGLDFYIEGSTIHTVSRDRTSDPSKMMQDAIGHLIRDIKAVETIAGALRVKA